MNKLPNSMNDIRNRPRRREWHSAPPQPLLIGLLVAIVAFASAPALAFKWHSCPTLPLAVYPSTLGATHSPFIHPGHPLTIVLNQEEVVQTGGFSPLPDGNEILVTFESLFGAPIQMPLRRATATSDTVLSFDFPDALDEIGMTLAGPVRVEVTVDGEITAVIAGSDLVGLPPANDIAFLVSGEQPTQIASAALASNGDLWIPARFRGTPVSMPMCPGDFIVPQPVHIGAVEIAGVSLKERDPFGLIQGYLGDFVSNGANLYGMLVDERIRLVHVPGTLGVSVCHLNDAIDLVFQVRGQRSWALDQTSPFRSVAASSAPVTMELRGAPLPPTPSKEGKSKPNLADGGRQDSFGSLCE